MALGREQGEVWVVESQLCQALYLFVDFSEVLQQTLIEGFSQVLCFPSEVPTLLFTEWNFVLVDV